MRTCKRCGTNIDHKNKGAKFCSNTCRHVYRNTSEIQYQHISGNWKKYLLRLLYSGGKKRINLSVESMLEVLEKQNYKCALSGIDLTCNLEVGVNFPTNASIDRIEAGGPYIKENIQFVCKSLNYFRKNTTISEFVWWCKQVAKYNDN